MTTIPLLVAVGDVDVVHADAEAGDDPAAGHLLDHLGGDFGVGGQDGIGVAGNFQDGFRRRRLGEPQFSADLGHDLAGRVQVREDRVGNSNQPAFH